MKSKIFILLLVSAFSFTCNSAENGNHPEDSKNIGIAGGWSDSEITPEVEKAAEFALKAMNTSSQLDKIVAAKIQMVAGVNYSIEMLLKNGEHWNTVVYQDLNDKYELTAAKIKK